MVFAGSCLTRWGASPQPVEGVVVVSAMCLCTFLGKSTLSWELCAAAHSGSEVIQSRWKLDVRWASRSSACQIRDSRSLPKPSGAKFRLSSQPS